MYNFGCFTLEIARLDARLNRPGQSFRSTANDIGQGRMADVRRFLRGPGPVLFCYGSSDPIPIREANP